MRWLDLTRYAGAAALFAVGADHLDEYLFGNYSVVPTIGTLFVLNFVSATVVALALVAPVARRAQRTLSLAGLGIAAGSLAALVVSEHHTLFGFQEFGYRSAIVVAIALDVAAIVLLAAFVAISRPGERTRHQRYATYGAMRRS